MTIAERFKKDHIELQKKATPYPHVQHNFVRFKASSEGIALEEKDTYLFKDGSLLKITEYYAENIVTCYKSLLDYNSSNNKDNP